MVIRKIKLEEIIWIILLSVAFSSNSFLQVIISILITVFVLFNSRNNKNLQKKDVRRLLKVFLFPCIAVHVYSFILVQFGISDFSILSTNLLTYLPIIVAIMLTWRYGFNGCIDVFIAIFITFFINFIHQLSIYGFASIVESFKSFFLLLDNSGGGFFELHDPILAMGYFIILFLNSSYFNKKNTIRLLIMYAFVFVFGGKRICVLALAVTIAFFTFTKKNKLNSQKRICMFCGYGVIVLGLVYIWLISGPSFVESLTDKYGINLMARNIFWLSTMDQATFSPLFAGYGRGFVKLWMSSHFHGYMHVHNDYLKMYMEIGFIPYILWIWYYMVYLQKKMRNWYGDHVAFVYFLTMIFTFILYLTDNTEGYFICGMVRTIIPVSLISVELKKQNEI